MDARTELFAYMGAATVTIAVLFGLQIWYASYLDVAVVHGQLNAPLNPKVVSHREQDRQKLDSAKVPIGKAMEDLGKRGRAAFSTIAPKPSDDLSAMSGWMHRPDFRPYEPRKGAPAPEAAAPEAAPAEGEVAQAPGATPPPAAAPAAGQPKRAPKVAPAAHP